MTLPLRAAEAPPIDPKKRRRRRVMKRREGIFAIRFELVFLKIFSIILKKSVLDLRRDGDAHCDLLPSSGPDISVEVAFIFLPPSPDSRRSRLPGDYTTAKNHYLFALQILKHFEICFYLDLPQLIKILHI
jgi:hypothetical protein